MMGVAEEHDIFEKPGSDLVCVGDKFGIVETVKGAVGLPMPGVGTHGGEEQATLHWLQ